MQVNKFSSLNFFTKQNSTNLNNQNTQKLITTTPSTNLLNVYFNDYLLSFEARVDKGLARFYEENKERMPHTVKTYIDTLPNKRGLTPLQAQYNAYSALIYAQSVDDIKKSYPDEELFSTLKPSSKNKATKGLLYDIRLMSADLKKDGETVLPNDEDLSVYIVKKIFLEAKSLNEINEDLDKDINPIFKKEGKNYINYSTLDTLGIKLPNSEYLTSLRFTRDGYSDEIGLKISEAQQKYYENLSSEERSQRAKKSLSNIEHWWTSLSDHEKKELLLSQDQELDLLKKYQDRKIQSEKPMQDKQKHPSQISSTTKYIHQQEKLHTSLSDDSMFLEWATKNLRIYYESLSEAEKQQISEKRSQTMIDRWNSMDEAQKAAYIEKMQTGSEKQRFAMINAWNNCEDIRSHMSEFMKEKNIHNPGNFIYRSQEYTEAQRDLMISFWRTYPEDAEKLGEEIKKSWEEINQAQSNGTFEELKESIIITQTRIKKDMKKHNSNSEQNSSFENFTKTYRKAFPHLPEKFMQAYFNFAKQTLEDKDIDLWTKLLNKSISKTEKEYLSQKLRSIDDSTLFTEKRAIEQALAEILYKATDDPNVFSLTFNDLNLLLSLQSSGKFELTLDNGKRIVSIKRKPDCSQLNKLYQKYNKKLSDKDIDSIIKTNFFIGEEDKSKLEPPLREYLRNYGQASMFIFGPYGTKEIKLAAFQKFQQLMPQEIKQYGIGSQTLDKPFEDSLYDEYSKEYYFIPEEFRKFYIKQITTDKTSPECRSLINSLHNSDNKTVVPQKPQEFSEEFIRKRLAMEQVLAEAIYKQIKNPMIFGLTYEQLAYLSKTILNTKSSQFPVNFYMRSSNEQNTTKITINKQIDVSNLSTKYNKYIKEPSQAEKSLLSIDNNYGSTILYITDPQIRKIVISKLLIYNEHKKS